MHYDVIIVGAGAAGMMCAVTAGKRNRRVLILDHSNKAGKKILISGGGRCNFTNLLASPENYLSDNPYFCISALKRYTPDDFLNLVKQYGIAYHEKTVGQLFCDHSAKDILQMLLHLCEQYHVSLRLNTNIHAIEKTDRFDVSTSRGVFSADSLVIATGGLSFPTMGASPFGYQVAAQFGLPVLPVRAALVPFTLMEKDLARYRDLAGISAPVSVTTANKTFTEALLFTHRGLSGPAMLQISTYWRQNESLIIDWMAGEDFATWFDACRQQQPNASLKNALAQRLSQRVAERFAELGFFNNLKLSEFSTKKIEATAQALQAWKIKPNGTEGYRTAEVTLGGVSTQALSSKTMMSQKVEGLYFIGEVVDVTGELGGYNFQWAWASGFCAGQYV